VTALVRALRDICGAQAVLEERSDLEAYVTDWRGVYTGTALCVVRPATVHETARVVAACREHGAVVVPQGGNTGLAAGATPLALSNAVIVSLSRMRTVRSVDAPGCTLAVDAGCVLADVQETARAAGRLFPLALAAQGSAQIGGLIATNAGGTAVLRYGSMRSLVLGLEVVLADGTIVDGMRALRKDNAGYDWKQLFIGSEGTLGVITGAVLRLFPTVRSSVTALAGCGTAQAAMDAFALLNESLGETLSACELFHDDAVQLRCAYDPSLVRPMPASPWYLLLEAGSSLRSLSEAVEAGLERAVERGFVDDCVVAGTSAQARALWEWRESISESEKRSGPSAKHDVSVPVSAIPAFLERAASAVVERHPGVRVLPFGHAGDGNIHFNVLLPGDGSVDAASVNATVHAIVAEFRGSITAEHGIGRYRRDELPEHRSDAEMRVLRAIKHALDPDGRMNPGAMLAI
jgi:FAD/FMN-containing dehydrogenase